MYTEPLLALSSWYPLLPPPVYTAYDEGFAKNVLDMRINVAVPNDISPDTAMDSGMRAEVVSYTASAVTVKLTMLYNGNEHSEDIILPVYAGRGSRPNPGGNYCILADAIEQVDEISSGMLVHPDCIFITQQCSYMTVKFDSDYPTSNGEPGGLRPYFCFNSGHAPEFYDGRNVSVDFSGNSLYITGGSGFGKGLYDVFPFIDSPRQEKDISRGLRSINGNTGDVTLFSPGKNLFIDVESVPDGFSSDGRRINLTISLPDTSGSEEV